MSLYSQGFSYPDGEVYVPLCGQCIPMSTAIVWFRLPEGFAIGSDGRNSHPEMHIPVDDESRNPSSR